MEQMGSLLLIQLRVAEQGILLVLCRILSVVLVLRR